MQLQSSLGTPDCTGINHAGFSIDGRYASSTRESQGSIVNIYFVNRIVIGCLQLTEDGIPQDIRVSPKRQVFYVRAFREWP